MSIKNNLNLCILRMRISSWTEFPLSERMILVCTTCIWCCFWLTVLPGDALIHCYFVANTLGSRFLWYHIFIRLCIIFCLVLCLAKYMHVLHYQHCLDVHNPSHLGQTATTLVHLLLSIAVQINWNHEENLITDGSSEDG